MMPCLWQVGRLGQRVKRNPVSCQALCRAPNGSKGGASLCWKDRARITMAARLKLLVRFKQARKGKIGLLDSLSYGKHWKTR